MCYDRRNGASAFFHSKEKVPYDALQKGYVFRVFPGVLCFFQVFWSRIPGD